MKHFINAAAVIFTAAQVASLFPALAEPAPAVTSKTEGPQIQFSETVVDFGMVKSTDVVQHDFIVTNTGDTMLEIRDVKHACGCMVAGAWDRRIQPGQTGKIPIQFNPARFSGEVMKTVSVTCNDPVLAVHTLRIQSTVWHPINIKPAFIDFTPLAGEETREAKVVRIISNVDQPLTLDPPHSSNPAFKLEMKTVQPGKEFELRVNYEDSADNVRPRGTITIKTSSVDLPVIHIGAGAGRAGFSLSGPQREARLTENIFTFRVIPAADSFCRE